MNICAKKPAYIPICISIPVVGLFDSVYRYEIFMLCY